MPASMCATIPMLRTLDSSLLISPSIIPKSRACRRPGIVDGGTHARKRGTILLPAPLGQMVERPAVIPYLVENEQESVFDTLEAAFRPLAENPIPDDILEPHRRGRRWSTVGVSIPNPIFRLQLMAAMAGNRRCQRRSPSFHRPPDTGCRMSIRTDTGKWSDANLPSGLSAIVSCAITFTSDDTKT